MKRKTLHALFIAIAVFGLMLTGCDKANNPMVNINDDPDVALITPPASAQSAIIWAGQTTPVGHVYIWFTATNVVVLYKTDDPYHLTEAHVQIAATIEGIPISGNGGPAPGSFEWKAEFAATNEKLFEVPFTEIPGYQPGVTTLVVAAHCVVVKEGEPYWNETGWAGDKEFEGNNWAKYFEVTVRKVLNLPTTAVTAYARKALGSGGPYYFQLANVDPGFDVTNGYYYGACLEQGVRNLYLNNPYTTILRSSYDAGLPWYIANKPGTDNKHLASYGLIPYDKINYLINAHSATDLTTLNHIQNIVWKFAGYNISLDATELLWYQDANTNGGGFYPKKGQWMVIILDWGSVTQLCFIRVDP